MYIDLLPVCPTCRLEVFSTKSRLSSFDRCSAQTLRKYERAGLLTPSRQQGNQRLYSAADVQRLLRIRYLVEVRGVNIAGLELALAMSDRLDAVGSDPTQAELQTAVDEASGMSREPS